MLIRFSTPALKLHQDSRTIAYYRYILVMRMRRAGKIVTGTKKSDYIWCWIWVVETRVWRPRLSFRGERRLLESVTFCRGEPDMRASPEAMSNEKRSVKARACDVWSREVGGCVSRYVGVGWVVVLEVWAEGGSVGLVKTVDGWWNTGGGWSSARLEDVGLAAFQSPYVKSACWFLRWEVDGRDRSTLKRDWTCDPRLCTVDE